jgi:protease II
MIDNISFPSEGSTIFSLCWIHKKHPGFFYTRLDTDSSHQQIVCFHQIGTTQNNDIIIYTCQGDAYNDMLPSLAPIITVSYNDDYLIVELFVESDSFSRSAYSGKGNKLVIIDVSHFDGQDKNSLGDVYVIVDSVSNRWEYINNDGEEFLFRTNYLSEGFRMVKYLLGDRFLNDLVEYIPMDSKKMVMEEAYMAAQTVLVLKCFNSLNGAHVVLLYDLCESGGILRGPLESVASLPHPPFGVIGALNCSYFSNDIFYGFSSFSEPSSIYRAVVRRHAEDQDIELSFDQVVSVIIVCLLNFFVYWFDPFLYLFLSGLFVWKVRSRVPLL